MSSGTLYIVSTPIGNLEDITLRALRVLREVDIVACEDTRRTGILLSSHGIKQNLTSFRSHNKNAKTPEIIRILESGKNVALVSDSGTPGISDPGYTLVRKCIEKNIDISAVPGAVSFVIGLILSGRPTNKFVFEGFLSNKSGRRKNRLAELVKDERTIILYESPHRIERFLKDFKDLAGDREIVLARELTKKFEEIKRGSAQSHIDNFNVNKPRGEFVVVF